MITTQQGRIIDETVESSEYIASLEARGVIKLEEPVKKKRTRINSEKLTCPIEGCERLSKNETSLKAHLLFTHNTLSPICTTKAYFQHIEDCDEVRKRYNILKYQLKNSTSHYRRLLKWADNLAEMLGIGFPNYHGRWYGETKHRYRYGLNEYYNKLCLRLDEAGEKVVLMNESLRGIFQEGNEKGILLE